MLDGFFERVARELCPENLFLIRIDNWFDKKWVDFAGTIALEPTFLGSIQLPVATSGARLRGRARVVPPFTPRRVVRQDHYLCDGGIARLPEKPIQVHPAERVSGDWRSARRILEVCDSGFFFWLSSDSASTGRGSLMCYHSKEKRVGAWYASFEVAKSGRWVVSRTMNIDRETIGDLIVGRPE
ncbi:MAG: hypothetical protein AAF354_15145 [Pseudomonadota bacterium]